MESVPYLTSHPDIRSLVRSKYILANPYHANFKSADLDFVMYNYTNFSKYIYLLFQIDLKNSVKIFLYMAREYHISPEFIYNLPYYEYEWYLDELNDNAKEQEKQQKEQQKDMDAMKSNMNPASMMKGIQGSMPKIGNFSMPKL